MKNSIKAAILGLAAAAVIVAGCTTTQVKENPPGSGILTTNVVVDPRLTGALDTIKAVNDSTAAVNPYSVPIDIGLGAITLIAGWIAKRKNDKLAMTNNLLRVVVQGVDQANVPTVKETIQKHAENMGVEGALSQVVNAVGKNLEI